MFSELVSIEDAATIGTAVGVSLGGALQDHKSEGSFMNSLYLYSMSCHGHFHLLGITSCSKSGALGIALGVGLGLAPALAAAFLAEGCDSSIPLLTLREAHVSGPGP